LNLLQEYFLRPYQSPIQKYQLGDGVIIYIKRDDLSFASFGTKVRKFVGIYQHLQKAGYTGVVLRGNPHANFLGCFAYLFKLFGFQVFTIAHLHYHTKATPNSILAGKYSDALFVVETLQEDQNINERLLKDDKSLFSLPPYGVHEQAIIGLKTLWDEIDAYPISFDHICLDVGSGVTALSALAYRSERSLIGVSIGMKLFEMERWLPTIASDCGLNVDTNNIHLLSPQTSPSFATTNTSLNTFIKDAYSNFGLPLEPVYSGKSLYTIVQYLTENDIKGNVLYIHQGGLLNHVSLFS
jgi:1-aminocyclopropane-1-carboxylate deaminase